MDLIFKELFLDTMEFTDGGKKFDLHSDYTCYQIKYDGDSRVFQFYFRLIDRNEIIDSIILLEFHSSTIMKAFLKHNHDMPFTISQLYRGRFELGDSLSEYRHDNHGYYYINFENGNSWEFFSNRVTVKEL